MNRQAKSSRPAGSEDIGLDYANGLLPDGAVLLSYLDVTDSVRVERALRQRAEALAEALEEPLRTDLAERGRRRLAAHSWEATAAGLADLYRRAAGRS